MEKVVKKPRQGTKPNAPTVINIQIDKSKIREVIGSGGKVIKDICEKSNAKVEIDDSGLISIFASKSDDGEIAREMINDIVAEPEIGKITKERL